MRWFICLKAAVNPEPLLLLYRMDFNQLTIASITKVFIYLFFYLDKKKIMRLYTAYEE